MSGEFEPGKIFIQLGLGFNIYKAYMEHLSLFFCGDINANINAKIL